MTGLFRMLELELDNEAASAALARSLAALLEAGDVVGLEGELGAGKTTFTREAVHGLGVPEETAVTSPPTHTIRPRPTCARSHPIQSPTSGRPVRL